MPQKVLAEGDGSSPHHKHLTVFGWVKEKGLFINRGVISTSKSHRQKVSLALLPASHLPKAAVPRVEQERAPSSYVSAALGTGLTSES